MGGPAVPDMIQGVRAPAEPHELGFIDFVDNPLFHEPDAEAVILASSDSQAPAAPRKSLPHDLPAHLGRLCEAELLTAEWERELFRRMNYLKFRAHQLRSCGDPSRSPVQLADAVAMLLDQARAIRDDIVKANVRLVMAIVKKLVTPQVSFDELLSDGLVSLMQSVEKFDYDRGFRFSTYAYRSIARNAYRHLGDRQRENSRCLSSSETLVDVASPATEAALDETSWDSAQVLLQQALSQLESREQFIIRGRFGIGSERSPRTFQSLAQSLGVSKERVRQLEQRAMAKLRRMAAGLRIDEMLQPMAT